MTNFKDTIIAVNQSSAKRPKMAPGSAFHTERLCNIIMIIIMASAAAGGDRCIIN